MRLKPLFVWLLMSVLYACGGVICQANDWITKPSYWALYGFVWGVATLGVMLWMDEQ